MTAPIQDLRDAIALLQQHDNQYLETDHPVDPNAELAGVYRHIGAGGTVKRPTRIGPAMMFNNIKGYPHSRILVGMHASRQRAALLLGCEASQPQINGLTLAFLGEQEKAALIQRVAKG